MKSVAAIALLSTLSLTSAYSPNAAISVAAKGMGLLKPIFKLEAQIQAAALGAIGKVDKEEIVADIKNLKTKNKALIYTYGLSPFSTEAKAILEGTGYAFFEVELGPEWFLLGGKGSVTRVALSEEVEGGATSLPKIFIGGKCIGGCSELSELAKSGELETTLAKAKVPKKGGAAKKGAFSLVKF
jgi:glutaredoxin